MIGDAQNLKNIPKDETQIPAEHRSSLEHLLNILESAQRKLQEASNKYGARPKRFRSKVKYFFTYLDRNECTEILEACQNDITGALVALPDRWSPQVTPGESSDRSPNFDTQAIPQPTPVAHPAEPAEKPGASATNSTTPVAPSQTPPAPMHAPNQQQVVPEGNSTGPSKRRKPLSAIKTALDIIEAASKPIPVAGPYLEAAAKVGNIVVQMVQGMDSNEETAKDLKDHASRLSEVLDTARGESVRKQKEIMTACMNDVQKELQSLQAKLEEMNGLSRANKAFFFRDHDETMKGYKEKIRIALEVMQVLNNLNTARLVTELHDAEGRKEQRRLLGLLGDAKYGIRGAAVEDVICLPNTRVQTLERIDTWIRSRQPSENVLWIRGMAGRGKSTIASTVEYRWRFHAATAIFHFRRGQKASDTGLVCALARQLGGNDLVPELKKPILEAVANDEDIGLKRLQDQFQKLFVVPLSKVPNNSCPVLLIVDALDECEDVKYAVKFVELIESYASSFSANVKFLVTTRPETPLLRALEPIQGQAENLDSATNVGDDVAQFFQAGFSKIRKQHNLGEDWPNPENVQALVDMSQGLFQWAHTAIEYIMEGSPQLRIQELLLSPSICDGLDALYEQILLEAFKKASKSPLRQDIFLRVLGTLVVAPYSISLEVLAFLFADHALFQNQSDIVGLLRAEALNDLRSLIHVPHSSTDPVHLMHTSVRDLLVERCGGAPYAVDVANNHRSMALKCLELMESDLKTNICKLSDLSKPSSDPSIQELFWDAEAAVPIGEPLSVRITSILPKVTSTLVSSKSKGNLPHPDMAIYLENP
ncbi:hypothetical protein M407DRAFT_20080 [Tulasnella calospora MUT 4182]|uniref:Nephrocystin 3-like N-terminal domain-containing protein n=1 Tax=Tulasnella calospora MUT 4182 TaxID=1051891 RepID=A0A0C3MB51_9AGAM|nr:hypothetical protein M407DRAFT_20080 [Tulasnella calospora MUT 4182]